MIRIYLFSYNSSTGTFTVPPGGDGFYYFSAYFAVRYFESAYINIQINGETICTAYADRSTSIYTDNDHTSCNAITYATEGNWKEHVNNKITESLIDTVHVNKLIVNLCWIFKFPHFLALAGDTVQVVYRQGTDTSPLVAVTYYYLNGFSGFRIWVRF